MSDPTAPTPPSTSAATGLSNVPVLPLRDVVVYPHMVIPLFVGREKSIQALDVAMKRDKRIMLVAQKQADVDDPKADDLYRIGTVATILQLLKLPGRHRQGAGRGRRPRAHREAARPASYYSADLTLLPDVEAYDEREMDVLARSRHLPVRAVREAQQEGAARGADRARRHRARRAASPTPSPRTCR